MLHAAGHFVQEEQQDPLMGATARLHIVEFVSAERGPVSFHVSVVIPLRS